jgi:hypothetical protein
MRDMKNLRSSRLIVENDLNFIHLYKLRERDQMTGWEIISSLPLEEQQELDLCHLPSAFKKVLNDYDKRFGKDHYSFLKACKTLYKWNGSEWNVWHGHDFEIVLK